MSERRDSVGTRVVGPLQRQSQGGGLYEDATPFMAGVEQPTCREMSVTCNSTQMLYQQQISPFCLQCGANGHWAAKCQSKQACSVGTQTVSSSSARKEDRAEESRQDREAGTELDREKKRVGFGRMFDLRDNWKEVTDSINKRGEGALWQLTADWRKRDDEEPTERSELGSIRGQIGAEKNSRNRVNISSGGYLVQRRTTYERYGGSFGNGV